ncbi:hypothetical protein ACIGXF_09710 [Streptomyces sp. NPDC053086]|uniref:hypothetical protein n=1 Tax=unclassified Streptomyces TaxID=2593676 RepID=UPI0037D1ED3D
MGRLRVSNEGEDLLELTLEPYGSDHWLLPGETFIVWTVGSPGEEHLWSGTALGHEPFEVDHRPGSVTVHINSSIGYVTDVHGNEIDCGHRRPTGSGTA